MIAQLDHWSSPIKITCQQALHFLSFISLHTLVIVLFVTRNGITESHMLCNCLLFLLCYCCEIIFAHWVIWRNLWLIQLLDDDVDLFITILLMLHGITESCWTLYCLRQLLKNFKTENVVLIMHLDGWSTATADKLTLLHDHPLLNNSNIIVIKRGTAIVVHEKQIVCERN